MKKLLVCQHDPGDDLRAWRPLLRARGVELRVADFSARPGLRPGLKDRDGLVLLGGSADVHERRPHLLHEMGLVRQAAAKGLPVLGICLGAQLTAKALGGSVLKSSRPEIGWYPLGLSAAGRRDPFLQDAGPRPRVFQWHAYEFSLPRGATLLASSRACRNQAFRLGPTVFAAQFHFEVDGATIRDWLAGWNLKDTALAAAIRKDTSARLAASKALARGLWRAFAARL